MLHEADQLVQRNPSILAAGDSVSIQRPRVEPFAHGSRGDVANLRNLTGRQNILQLRCCVHSIFSQAGEFPFEPERPPTLLPTHCFPCNIEQSVATLSIDRPAFAFKPSAQILPLAMNSAENGILMRQRARI